MASDPRSVSPDALRVFMQSVEKTLRTVDRRLVAVEGSQAASATSALTDNQPRWITLIVPYTMFNGTVATSVDAVLVNLPAGTICSHEWIEPVVLFDSGGIVWRLSIKKVAPIYSAGGTAKATDVTTPDAIDQQHSNEHIVSDSAGANDWYVTLDSSGGDTADHLIAGSARVHLFVSIPGAVTDVLPHA